MHARALGAAAITTALVLLPTVAHAAAPETSGRAVTTSAVTASLDDRDPDVRRAGDSAAVAGPTAPAAAGSPVDLLVMLGLVALVGGSVVVVLRGGRPDDDEPAG